MASAILDNEISIEDVAASDLAAVFNDFSSLTSTISRVCGHLDNAVASKGRERFVELAKKHFESLPVPSSSTATLESGQGNKDDVQGKDTLVDSIWAVDQAYDNQAEADDATKARASLGHLVKAIQSSGLLSADYLKQRLDSPLLQQAGLLSAAGFAAWSKLEPRIKTGMLYKQQKFNLSREESEGYSKLEVELIGNMGPPHDSRTARPSEPLGVLHKRAEATVNNIKALIGFFDLDPTRALDIILDVFQDNIIYHHAFFRELLRLSPWGTSAKEDTSMDETTEEKKPLLPDGSLNPRSDSHTSVIAQILGFKFAWYTTTEGASETPSEKLYLLAAILIWDGFVDLQSLWPHLSPSSEDDMNRLKTKFGEDISERIANARSNALALAGVLMDDSTPAALPSRSTAQSGSVSILGSAAAAAAATNTSPAPAAVPADPPNTKLGLLRALLGIGALRPAFFILSSYPWICDPFPEVADLLLRVCNNAISPYYASQASPFCGKSEIHEKRSSLQQGRPRWSVPDKKILPAPAKAFSITGRPIDTPRTINGSWREPVYFFPDWQQRLPVCSTTEDVVEVVGQILKLVGVHAGRNQDFLVRLLRVVKVELAKQDAHLKIWEGIVRMHLIPALSLSDPNPSISTEFWSIISNMPLTTRFAYYGEWKDRSYKRFPELRVRRAEAERDAKGLLKRLSVDNVKQFGRSLAKVAHCNPCVLFEIALNQVQSYDNLVGPVVESVRYLTPFGYDVLAYSLLDALSNPEKERTKTDGTNISLWLQSLATFSGTLCRRWSIDVSIILQYILNQLRESNPKDLVVLRELISKMTGIEPVADLSDAQVVALGGGRTLQSEALNPTTAIEKKNATKRSTIRLRNALVDSKLIVPLLIAVAYQRQECVFGDESAPLKYLGNLFDQCQQVLFQYLDLLLSQFSAEQFGSMMPSLKEAWSLYGLDASIAFQIVRPGLQKAIQVQDLEAKAAVELRLKQELKASREKQEAAKLENGMPSAPNTQMNGASPMPESGEVKVEEQDVKLAETPDVVSSDETTKKSPWHPALQESIRVAEQQLSMEVRTHIAPGFFVTFWQLSLYDIHVPSKRYMTEVDRLKSIIKEIDQSLKATIPSFPGQIMDRSGDVDKRKAKERCQAVSDAISKDFKEHAEVFEATKKRMQKEKRHWFMAEMPEMSVKEMGAARKVAVQYFVQECLLPRSRLSPIDAAFCARFIRALHNIGTANFPSLHVYDRLFSEELPAIVFHCTEGEARNYGRFLHDCLADLALWHGDEALYNKQAIGGNLPGFQRTWGARKPGDPIPEKDFLKHGQFLAINTKWQKRLYEAFNATISSHDYMCIRNSILILTKIAKYFPRTPTHGNALEATIANLIATEKREDLKVLAIGYSALLKKQSSTWTEASGAPNAQPVAIKVEAPAAAAKPAIKAAPSPAASPLPSAPTGPRSSLAPGTVTAAPTHGGASPTPRPAGLPARPMTEAEKRRQDRATNGSSTPRPLETNTASSGARTPSHALPQRPSAENERRDGNSARAVANHVQSSSQMARAVSSRPATPVASRESDAMDVDERTAVSNQEVRKDELTSLKDKPKDSGNKAAEFARPADPEARSNHSRAPSPSRDGQSPRLVRKNTQSSITQSPRDERRSRPDMADATRRSRAGSEESSHSSHRERRDRDKDRSDRDRRRDRDRDRERDRDRRSDRPSDREKERDAHRSSRDKGRDRDRPLEADLQERDRRKDTESDKDVNSKSDRRSEKDRGDRERERERDRERGRDRAKEEKPRDRDTRTRTTDKDERRIAGSSRREERGRDKDEDTEKSREKNRLQSRPQDERDNKFNGSGRGTLEPQAASLAQRDLKRPAEDLTGETGAVDRSSKPEEAASKRPRTDESSIPSGPRADRLPPAPLPSLPPKTSGTSTSIKGRASARTQGDQGMRIKSAASALNALSSAQEHNARMDRHTRSSTPATPSEPASAKQTPAPAIETASFATAADASSSRPASPQEERSSGLLGRLAPRTSEEQNRRSSSDRSRPRRK